MQYFLTPSTARGLFREPACLLLNAALHLLVLMLYFVLPPHRLTSLRFCPVPFLCHRLCFCVCACAGYKKASEAAFKMLEELSEKRVDNPRDRAQMLSVVRPVIASKQGGYEDLLAGLVADAVLSVMPHEPRAPSVNVDNIRVAKLIGGTIGDSAIVKGVVVQREPEGTIRRAEKAKIAVFGCSIEASSPETRGTVVIKTADELMAYNKSEEAMMEESIRGIAESGAKVVVAGGSISEIAMHYIEKYGMMAIKVSKK